ncbi:tyrosine-type recombinase/integrase [Altererythrobacter luteolus]|uniref:Tyrosine-type recombinase/integrase n=1 Tax=Pontixanthobacter luteolus TaxID=295089 RepID=A0A6I4V2B2_9SPHN|nr:site-specific integrase [Pontixanthobacter luteolus]MXP48439.1 tyrosine-type recombinase/integrase [Pontixanthobacter luteolus]
MPTTTEKLTANFLRLKNKKPGKYGDGNNLWLIVGPTGRERWEFRYTLNGRSREMSLGPADEKTVHEAREDVRDLRKQVRQGVDPLADRTKVSKARITTFAEVAEQCIASLRAGWTNDKSEKQWRSTLKTYANPKIGEMDVSSIVTADIFAALEPIWTTKAETAKRVRERMEKVLDFATAMDLRSGDNPARWRGNLDHLFPKATKVQKVRHHPALPYDQLADFIAALRDREGIAARALEFTIQTASRTSEALGATWSEIDLDKAVWTIPAERMKARKDHRVPLNDIAVRLLKSLPRDTEGDYVFMSPQNRGKPLSNMAMLKTLKLMGRDDLTVHGFRSTFRDWAAETTSYPDAVVEMALAHTVSNAVEAAYRRGDLFEKRARLMADWSAFSEGDSRAGAEIVPIRR